MFTLHFHRNVCISVVSYYQNQLLVFGTITLLNEETNSRLWLLPAATPLRLDASAPSLILFWRDNPLYVYGGTMETRQLPFVRSCEVSGSDCGASAGLCFQILCCSVGLKDWNVTLTLWCEGSPDSTGSRMIKLYKFNLKSFYLFFGSYHKSWTTQGMCLSLDQCPQNRQDMEYAV